MKLYKSLKFYQRYSCKQCDFIMTSTNYCKLDIFDRQEKINEGKKIQNAKYKIQNTKNFRNTSENTYR